MPILNRGHQEKRFKTSLDLLTVRADLEAILFTDEKCFNLDGPNRYRKAWVQIGEGEDNHILFKRQQGGRNVMAWISFFGPTKGPLFFFEGTVDSRNYITHIANNVIPWLETLDELPFTFQQDNAPAHVSKLTIEFFNTHNISLMDWPAHSPDLNPVELIWAELSRMVYVPGRHFSNLRSLQEAIQKAWEDISTDFLHNIIVHTWERLINTLLVRGKWNKAAELI